MKIAGVQMDVSLGEVAKNMERIGHFAKLAAEQGSELVVFPECAVTGYCFESKEAAWPHATEIPGPHVEQLQAISRQYQITLVTGSLEKCGDQLFNVALCVGPDGLMESYRKTHLPHLGVDHFVTPGGIQRGRHPYRVFSVGELRVGMLICYDASFPEASRMLSLAGADLIVLPTNWPPGAEQTADFVVNARASENKIYFMSVNRIGTEGGFSFIGKSKICDVHGTTLVFEDHRREAVLFAEIDPAEARDKRIQRAVGHWINRIDDRRPELYGALVE